MAQGKIENAIEKFNKALKTAPNDKSVKQELEKIELIQKHVKKGQAQFEEKKYEEALETYNIILSLSPQSIPFKLFKGEILLELKKYDDASKIAGSILQFDDSSSSDALFLRGKALYYLGQSEQGSSLLLQALNLDPDNTKCLHFRKKIQKMENLKKEGNDLLKNGEYQKAYDKYTEASELDPNAPNLNSQLYCNRSAAAQKMNNHKLAIEDATKAIDLNPNYSKAYQRRSQSYTKLEKYEEALYDLNKVNELEPGNRDISKQIKELSKLAKQAKRKDYYKILGVEKNASTEEIEKAYKKVAFQNHPDRFPSEEKEERTKAFHDIGEAKSILTDPQKRRQYDQGMDINDINSGGGNPFGGHDMSDIFSMFMGSGMGGMGGGMDDMPGGFSFSFGGPGGMGSSGKKKQRRFNF